MQPQSGKNAVHLSPGILSIGIILLEIALSVRCPPPLGKFQPTNVRLQIAKDRLQDLKENEWDTFSFQHKPMFVTTVEQCLKFRNDIPERKAPDEFYTKVVCPLA